MEPQALKSQTLQLRERISSLGGRVGKSQQLSAAVESSCKTGGRTELSGDVAAEWMAQFCVAGGKRTAFSH